MKIGYFYFYSYFRMLKFWYFYFYSYFRNKKFRYFYFYSYFENMEILILFQVWDDEVIKKGLSEKVTKCCISQGCESRF